MSRVTAYWTAFFIACTSSGGIILGLSAFADHAIKLGLLNASDSEVVFTVGFQMLTWLSLFWSSQQDALGPRACAVLGMSLAAAGNLLVALLASSPGKSSPYLYAVAFGLIGGGGNGAYLSSFQFASLFANVGLRCSLLSVAFNTAGAFYLTLNLGVSPAPFFLGAGIYTLVLVLAVASLFPHQAYRYGDQVVLTALNASSCEASDRAPDKQAAAGFFVSLRRCSPALRLVRFWLFCLTFAWASLTQQWALSALILIFPAAGDDYHKWAVRHTLVLLGIDQTPPS